MYRIRSASGSEAVYNSLEEFHAAVRRGEVDAEDEIFHTRANRWLDVKSHPHYRSAVGWNGSGEPSLPPAPPGAAHPPAPAPRVAPAPQAAEARAQAAEPARPAAIAQQIVLRPQLVVDWFFVTAAATPVAAPARGYGSDVDAMLAAVTDKTRIVCLANPNNPTGTYVSKDDVRRLHAGLPKNVLLIIDAAYAEYVSRNDYESGVELVDQAENVVMTRTFSKIYGLGGVRLGWMYGPAGIVDVMSRLRQPFNVNSAAQIAGIAALEDISHTDASRTNNDIWLPWLSAELTKLGLEPVPSVGNFLLVGFGSKERAVAANEWLMNDGLIPRLVAGYGLPEHLRITVGTEAEVKAVQASLARFVAAK